MSSGYSHIHSPVASFAQPATRYVPDSAQRFPQLFESPLLTAALDDLHGVNRAGAEGTEERRWQWLG